MSVIKVKPWGEDQGEFVLIEEADFNPEFHEHLDASTDDEHVPRPKRGKRGEA